MIYIIDNSTVSSALLEFVIAENYGIEVQKFHSISEALQQFNNHPPKAIITVQHFNCDQDNSTGLQLGTELMQHGINVPRILISSEDNQFLESKAIKAGFDCVVNKQSPSYIETIKSFIDAHITLIRNIDFERKSA